jgi:hypothetical protein
MNASQQNKCRHPCPFEGKSVARREFADALHAKTILIASNGHLRDFACDFRDVYVGASKKKGGYALTSYAHGELLHIDCNKFDCPSRMNNAVFTHGKCMCEPPRKIPSGLLLAAGREFRKMMREP